MTITLDTPVAVTASPSLLSRIAARLGARHYDRLVLSGASPNAGSALEVHVVRLTSVECRERLAADLRHRGTAVLCDRVMSATRVKYPSVWDAADLIERVEKRLLAGCDISPRGTARLRRLLTDWNGPLRNRGSGDLCAELRAVLAAL
ncbi:hypothetical protein ACGFK1_00705 [Mycobacterium sp. NPDC048908]|uniref:hypothetical protein n=1 Tax=Mycobacterium sp. NPDC048908 TaxID=3364292 RepID=UPI00371D9070